MKVKVRAHRRKGKKVRKHKRKIKGRKIKKKSIPIGEAERLTLYHELDAEEGFRGIFGED